MANGVIQNVNADIAHGSPPVEGLEALIASFARFIEETAIPGKEAAVSQEEAVVCASLFTE